MRQPDGLLVCDDCGANDNYGQGEQGWNWSSVPMIAEVITSRIYCEHCRRRRGLLFLFDPRPWSQIEAALRGTAA